MGLKDRKRFNRLMNQCVSILGSVGVVVLRQITKPSPLIDPVSRQVIGVREMPEGTHSGAPEIMVFRSPNCQATAFKIKLDDRELTDDEVEFMNELLKIGAKYHIITSVEDLIRVLADENM